MPSESQLSEPTVRILADEMLNLPLAPKQREAVTALVNAIRSESSAMRELAVGAAEPATLYRADADAGP